MRLWLALSWTFALVVTHASAAADDEDPAPEEDFSDPVAEDSRPEPHGEPHEEEWVPISNSTEYVGVFDVPTVEARPSVEHHWYGLQTLTVDALSIGVLAVGDSKAGTYIGLGGYFLGGPLVHAAHGHVGKACGSLGLRAGAPIVGAIVGYAAERCGDQSEDEDYVCGTNGAAVGVLIGAAAAIVVDAAVLAHEDVEPDEAPDLARGPRVKPDILIARDRAVFQVSAAF